MEQLWKLALIDPSAVFNKISIRQLGKRRIERLHTYLYALDARKLYENRRFELLLLNLTEKELNAEMFAGVKKQVSGGGK